MAREGERGLREVGVAGVTGEADASIVGGGVVGAEASICCTCGIASIGDGEVGYAENSAGTKSYEVGSEEVGS